MAGGIGRCCALGAALVLLFTVLPVHAQKKKVAAASAADSAEARYEQAIRKALDEYAAGHWTEARIFFEDAHAISPNARTLRGLGSTSYEARRYVDAISLLEQALASQVRPLTTQMAQETGRLLEQARRFVSHVDLEVEPSEAEVRLDGDVLPPEKRAELIVDPGEHELTASAPGSEEARRTFRAEGGRRVTVHLSCARAGIEPALNVSSNRASLPPPAATVPAEAGAAPVSSDQSIALGVVIGVTGLAGVATGWVFYGLRQPTRQQGGDINLANIAAYQDHGYATVAAAGAGSLLLGISDYFWLPDSDGVPVAAWVVGGVGAAIALGGLAVAAFGPGCGIGDARETCRWSTSDTLFGPLIALHALPFLSVPFSYALRGWTRPSTADVGLRVLPIASRGALLTLSGRF